MLNFSKACKPLVSFYTIIPKRGKLNEEELLKIKRIRTEKKTSYFSFQFSHQINALFKQGKVSAALSLFSSRVQLSNKEKFTMSENDRHLSDRKKFLFVRPSVPIYNTLLKGLRDHGCSFLAYKFFIDMKKRALTPDSITYTLLLDSIANRATMDSSSKHSSGPICELTKQVKDPLNLCWDKFHEAKLKCSSGNETDRRIIFNALIKAVGALGDKYGSDLETLRVVFSPFKEEDKFPLSPGIDVIPSSDTISIAIKAASNLSAPLWFIEAYYDKAIASNMCIDPFIVCSLLSAYRLHIFGLPLNDSKRAAIAEKCFAFVEKHAKSASFRKSELFHGLTMTIYISAVSTPQGDYFLSLLMDHYRKFCRKLYDPVCLSLYIQTMMPKDPKEMLFMDLIGEVLRYKGKFPTWTYDKQIGIMSLFTPVFDAPKDGKEKKAIRECLCKLENAGIFSSIRQTLKDHKAPLSSANMAKTQALIEALKKYEN